MKLQYMAQELEELDVIWNRVGCGVERLKPGRRQFFHTKQNASTLKFIAGRGKN